jgi:hypothetical protein
MASVARTVRTYQGDNMIPFGKTLMRIMTMLSLNLLKRSDFVPPCMP